MAQISVVGVGGIGSWLIPPLVRFMSGNDLENIINIFDFDVVEYKNTVRQNFIPHDVGKYKVEVIAQRYSTDKVMINPRINTYIDVSEGIFDTNNKTSIVIGCVDNVRARKDLFDASIGYARYNKPVIYIDGGNSQISGNVHISLFYCDPDSSDVNVITSTHFLNLLDSDEDNSDIGISCANMQEQSTIANSRVSLEIMNYLLQISLNKNNILDMKNIDIEFVEEMINLGILPYSTFISFRNQYETDPKNIIKMVR